MVPAQAHASAGDRSTGIARMVPTINTPHCVTYPILVASSNLASQSDDSSASRATHGE